METETIDKLFLELSQVTNAETKREHDLMFAAAGAVKAFERIQKASTLKEAKSEAKITKRRVLEMIGRARN